MVVDIVMELADHRLDRTRTGAERVAPRLLAFVVVAVVVGCSPVVSPSPTQQPGTPTQQPGTPAACMAAALEGRLQPTAPLDLGVVDSASKLWNVSWPAGYSIRAAGRLEVVDDSGHVLAGTGDVIRVGGGTQDDQTWIACPGTVQILPLSAAP